ncbi:unnamed protein product [Rhizophagus irregularis]|nr:unnamed protein product [Rhizophagus irregularis]
MTTLSNKIQKEKSLLCEDEGIYYPNHFSLESVKERLDSYDVSNTPDKQALADVMIMLCIRSAEIKDLCISNGGVTGYVKNRDQQDISRVFRSLEKNEERAKQLLTWIQEAISSRRLGDSGTPGTGILSRSCICSCSEWVRNLSKTNTIASQALRHSPKNNTAPSQRYTIVNYRPRGMPYDQANPFMFFDEN